MNSPTPSGEQYVFGRFRLAVDATLLLEDGRQLRLAPKVLQTLRVLVDRAGEVVTKDELMALVWPGTFVEETGLTRNISVLRTALGDHADAIVTVPRIGYRFALPVSRNAALPPAPARAATTFVGREAELRTLTTALEEARRGRGGLIGLAGEPGIGKTTLAERVMGLARPHVLVGMGRATEVLGTTEPHLPVLEALDMLSGATGVAADLRRQAPTWAAHVRHTRDALAAGPTAGTPERLLRELVYFLSSLAERHPVLIVIDDMHWADAATTDVVTHLASRLADWPLLLIITYRDREYLPPGPPFSHARTELRAKGLLREIPLPLLTPADVVSYVAQARPELAGTDLAPRVHASSEGNPLFMTTLVSYLGEAAPGSGQLRARQLPESLRGLMTRTVERLAPEHRAVLDACALQGYAFDPATVAAALGRAEFDVADMLAVVERDHGLITRDEPEFARGHDDDRFRFRHALYQAALLEQLPPSRRVTLSAAMAEAVLARNASDPQEVAGPVALLLEQAHAHGRAAEQFAIAAERANERLAFRDAIDLARRGSASLERAHDISPHERTRLDCALTFAQLVPMSSARGPGHPAVQALTQRVTRLAEALDDPGSTARALGLTCFVHLVRGECRVARDAARQLVALAEAAGHVPLLVNGHMQAQIACHHLGDLADAEAHATEVMRLGLTLAPQARFMSLYDPVVASLAESSRNAWLAGRLRRSLELAEHAVALGGEIGNADSTSFAWLFHAWAHAYRGDWRTAVQSADHGVAVADRAGMVQTLAWNRCVRGWALAHQGDTTNGRRDLEQGMALSRSIMGEIALPQFRVMLAEVLRLEGSHDEARACIAEAIDAESLHDDAYFSAEIHRLAAICGAGGLARLSPAEQASQALAIARRQGATFLEVRAARSWFELTGDPQALRESLQRLPEPEPWHDVVEARKALQSLT